MQAFLGSMSAEALLTGVGEVSDEAPLLFSSRRSPVLSQNGIVSTSQPLATAAGLTILQKVRVIVDCTLNVFCFVSARRVDVPLRDCGIFERTLDEH